jgi:hypothetical protein
MEFLNRIFQMIDILSADMSDAVPTNTDINVIDATITSKLTSIMFNIVQQCSRKIFQVRISIDTPSPCRRLPISAI